MLRKGLSCSYKLAYWPNGKDVSEELRRENYKIIILDVQSEEEGGFTLLKRIKSLCPFTPVIMTSEEGGAELIVKAIKQGAFDFVPKPYTTSTIKLALEQALEHCNLKNEIDYLKHTQDVIYSFDGIIADSPAMKEIIASLKKFSKTDATILVTGETGTGKSFLSGTIHYNSTRKDKPFVKINCTNIPETLLESELFGHEKGAFTGASKTRLGRFEQGSGGTVFLDEIGELSLALQAKLLRVLDEKSFERVGGNRTIHSDVRIIVATNRILEDLVASGKFREDFYYRINVLSTRLPPLRERRKCIEPLANRLFDRSCRTLRKDVRGFSPEVVKMFESYSWPGNIRQLANTIERAVILEEGQTISKENVSLPEPMGLSKTKTEPRPNSTESLQMHEKELILKALEESLWIQKDAAKCLGVSPRVLNYKIRKFNITHPRWRKHI